MASLGLLCLALASSASASTLPAAPKQNLGFVSFPVTAETRSAPLSVVDRRDNTATLYNASQTTYLFELNIGTPQQKVNVVLDTGSFELWVGPSCSAASTKDQVQQCKNAGTYDPSQSSSVVDLEVTKTLSYGKGEVDIQYIADSVSVAGSNKVVMENVTFGLGRGSEELTFGIAGIGHGYNFNTRYYNLVDELAYNNVTATRSFSVALASKDANNGGIIIFGGVDTKKFSGPLYKFANLQPQIEGGRTGPWRYWVQLSSIGSTKPGGSSTTYSGSSMPIVLDTGSTLSYLPKTVIAQIANDLGLSTASDGTIPVPCSMASQAGTFDFTFGQLVLRVPYHEFIWEVTANQCFVGVAPQATTTTALLGDSFLRSAYILMDQDDQAIYIAPYANCGQNEQTFVTGANYTGECSISQKNDATPTSPSRNLWVPAALAVGFQILMALF